MYLLDDDNAFNVVIAAADQALREIALEAQLAEIEAEA